MRTTGKQCGLAATGDYQPSLRSPWLAAKDCRPLLCTCDADTEILTGLIIDVVARISAYNPIRIFHDFALGDPGPAFKYDHFIKLLTLRFMHVHNNHC